MEHKAEVTIGFLTRRPQAFRTAGTLVEALLTFSGNEIIVEVYSHKPEAYHVEFELHSKKSVQHLNKQIQLLAAYLQENCNIETFKANVWSSNDNFDAWYDPEEDQWCVASNLN